MRGALGPLALDEIAERHAFFERWFNGLGEDGALAESLARFDGGFRRVDPVGDVGDLAALRASLAARRGVRARDPVSIAVEDPAVLWEAEGAVLASYVEVQGLAASTERHRRRSTALFLAAQGGGLPLWRHVQETFLTPGGA